jgi:hypothetical protein
MLSTGEFTVLQAWAPGDDRPTNLAVVLLFDNRLYVRGADGKLNGFRDAENDLIASLPSLIDSMARQLGAEAAFSRIRNTWANTIRATDRIPVAVHSPEATLTDIFNALVQPQGEPSDSASIRPE